MEIELHDVAADKREGFTKKFKSNKEQLKLLQKEFVSCHFVPSSLTLLHTTTNAHVNAYKNTCTLTHTHEINYHGVIW